MKLTIRRIGNSLGVIVPREALRRWGVGEGDALELGEDSIRRPRRPVNRQAELDLLKRSMAMEVVRGHKLSEIRKVSIQNMLRWKAAGSWNSAYEAWLQMMKHGTDAAVLEAMVGDSDRANELRQSMPFVGMIPESVRSKLVEEATG
jgi:antitoxin component of MazEF toxin-antitoxin module